MRRTRSREAALPTYRLYPPPPRLTLRGPFPSLGDRLRALCPASALAIAGETAGAAAAIAAALPEDERHKVSFHVYWRASLSQLQGQRLTYSLDFTKTRRDIGMLDGSNPQKSTHTPQEHNPMHDSTEGVKRSSPAIAASDRLARDSCVAVSASRLLSLPRSVPGRLIRIDRLGFRLGARLGPALLARFSQRLLLLRLLLAPWSRRDGAGDGGGKTGCLVAAAPCGLREQDEGGGGAGPCRRFGLSAQSIVHSSKNLANA